MNVSVKMPPKMKKAIDKVAEKEFASISGIIKKSIEEYLYKHHNIDWRQEPEEEPKK